ncbi:putative lipoprotein, partial [Vibrio parahaemolyticus V-223/04]|jgi:hypothetical protein
MERW